METLPTHRYLRCFRTWEFFVSHSQLLIRSPKRSDSDVNVDIVFRGVEYMSIPGSFGTGAELTLVEGDESDLAHFAEVITVTYPERKVYWLVSDQHRYAVIAAWCRVYETSYELLESGLERSF